jgi:hypothetical protein
MIHGQATRRSRGEHRRAARSACSSSDYAHAVLFSLTRFKQGGARYA